MNIGLIFAGGTGQRMNTKTRPKQFLELHGKPIIIYTLEQFENHPEIDAVVVACLESWIPFLQKLLMRFQITKVADIVPGGKTGQGSIRNAIDRICELYPDDSIVLVHDGVRPLITADNISACIQSVKDYGSAVTVAPATETVIKEHDGFVEDIIDRKQCCLAKAPQCFRVGELKEAHDKAAAEGLIDFIDSASLMRYYGHDLHTVEGSPENIKITTPNDFYMFRAIEDARENSQILGI
ncbi:MAG: 2-C-methyl-D-erythritol 4-phosphate cytidylyltransferase [Eggerthellaceae bacterium]|jgi:2-C-methyl-D-erythritol 4-phosphate cytidylyltransferase